MLAESIPRKRFRGSLNVYKFGLCIDHDIDLLSKNSRNVYDLHTCTVHMNDLLIRRRVFSLWAAVSYVRIMHCRPPHDTWSASGQRGRPASPYRSGCEATYCMCKATNYIWEATYCICEATYLIRKPPSLSIVAFFCSWNSWSAAPCLSPVPVHCNPFRLN